MTLISWIIFLLVVFAVLIVLAAWFYRRSTNEVSLVRTGVGGRKVVVDGGMLAIPFFHEISPVNMQTIRMDVQRTGASSLITKDRMRIDVGAEFYASVVPEPEAIARAAQTLGRRTFQPDQLKSLIEGMLVDALRSAAAQMTMDELHESRSAFAEQVRDTLTPVLARYGLELDRVSLTALDQTPFSALDENNAFNAVGMRKLAEVIAKSKKERAEIEGESQVAVRRAEVEANRRKLEIELEERRAEIEQTREVEMLLATQLSEVARRKAEAEQEAANARINMERQIQETNIARELAIREAEIAQMRALDIAEQERLIQTSSKNREGSKAKADATSAQADVVRAEEELQTLRQIAEAERRGKVAVLNARQDAEANAVRARILAENDKDIAKHRSASRREEAEALKFSRMAEAEAEKARIAAENSRSQATVSLELEKARLAAMPEIIAQMVKPAEKIKGISINTISGLGSGSANEAGSPVNQTMDAILNLAVTLPAMKKLGDSIGINLEDITPDDKKAGPRSS
jgi:uncharacterized membrane protein YqiK